MPYLLTTMAITRYSCCIGQYSKISLVVFYEQIINVITRRRKKMINIIGPDFITDFKAAKGQIINKNLK
jgi:hypothetical protein